MPTQDMLLGFTPQINVAVGLAVCGCNETSPGLLEPGEFGMAPGPLVAGVGAEMGGIGMDPCPLAAGVGATIPPGEGLEIGPEATSVPKSQHCPKRACFPSVHFWSLFSNLANESFAAAQVVVVDCRVDDGSVTSLSEYI